MNRTRMEDEGMRLATKIRQTREAIRKEIKNLYDDLPNPSVTDELFDEQVGDFADEVKTLLADKYMLNEIKKILQGDKSGNGCQTLERRQP